MASARSHSHPHSRSSLETFPTVPAMPGLDWNGLQWTTVDWGYLCRSSSRLTRFSQLAVELSIEWLKIRSLAKQK